MNRRAFVLGGMASVAAAAEPRIMTVRGLVPASLLGFALAHEHLFSNFGGPPADPPSYEETALLASVTPYAKELHSLGCRAIFDATTYNFGRAPQLLRRISELSGLHVVTNTGWYGAAQGRYLPPEAERETPEQIAARWAGEHRQGIGQTGIRPGFIKCGVDPKALSPVDERIIRAAALCHRETGLTITVHTGNSASAAERQLAILREEGVAEPAWVWIHASSCREEAALWRAAGRGAWLCFDHASPANAADLARLLSLARRHKLLERVLLSHDGNAFRWQQQPRKPFDYLLRGVRQELGLEEAEWRLLTETNPAGAYALRVQTR